jgi:hypothetical protein
LRIRFILIGLALAVLAFPINTASGDNSPKLIFQVGVGTEPKVPIGPRLPDGPSLAELQKPQPKPQKRINKIDSKPRLKAPTGFTPCSCVSYARFITGINVGPIGVARNHPVNSSVPIIGAIMITYESRAGHASVVISFDDKFVYVNEANYSSCKVTYNRAIPIDSEVIKGYYK